MFTGAHLTVLILNAVMPLVWIFLIIRNLVEYYDLKCHLAKDDAQINHLKEQLPDVDDASPNDTPLLALRQDEVKRHRDTAEAMADTMLIRHKSELRFAKFNSLFWVFIGIGMSLCSVLSVVEMGVKIYHHNCPCELRDAKKVEVRVENAKEGPQFSVTTNNLRVE